MADHYLQLPLSKSDVQVLELGDMVYLTGDIISTAGIPTYQRIVEFMERDEALPIDITNGALFHLGSFSIEDDDGKLDIHYINPTTSTRFNNIMPKIIRHHRLRLVGGKGGLDQSSVDAMAETGCVYLSFLGGGATLHTQAIRNVKQVAWKDLIAHYRLVCLTVEKLGPLTVSIDAKGGSVFEDLKNKAKNKLPEILKHLKDARKS